MPCNFPEPKVISLQVERNLSTQLDERRKEGNY